VHFDLGYDGLAEKHILCRNKARRKGGLADLLVDIHEIRYAEGLALRTLLKFTIRLFVQSSRFAKIFA
jgi:hypothetical protein